MILLRDLSEQALASVADDPEGITLTTRDIYLLLDARGELNLHLRNPNRHEAGWTAPRDQPLTGSEPVHGDHLLLVYCSHDPFVHIREYESKEAMETALLGGVFNPYLNYVVPIISGKVAPFQVTYRSIGGAIEVYDRYNLDKFGVGPGDLDSKYRGREVMWLAA